MGIEEASPSAAITKNIEQALKDRGDLNKEELAARAGISKSTFYRNMNRPENFTFREAGQVAQVLELGLLDLLKEPS